MRSYRGRTAPGRRAPHPPSPVVVVAALVAVALLAACGRGEVPLSGAPPDSGVVEDLGPEPQDLGPQGEDLAPEDLGPEPQDLGPQPEDLGPEDPDLPVDAGPPPRCPYPQASDPDGDGLTSCAEYELLLHPELADSDGNGLFDGVVAIGERIRVRGPFDGAPVVRLDEQLLVSTLGEDGAWAQVTVPEGHPPGAAALSVEEVALATLRVTRLALVGGVEERLQRVDLGTLEPLGRWLRLPGPPGGLALLPGGRLALVTLPDSDQVQLVDVVQGEPVGDPAGVCELPRAVLALPAPGQALVACYFGQAVVGVSYGPEGLSVGDPLPLQGMPFDLALYPDGVAVSLSDSDEVVLLGTGDDDALQVTSRHPVEAGPETLAYDSLGDRLLVASGLAAAVTALPLEDLAPLRLELPADPMSLTLALAEPLAVVATLQGELLPAGLAGGRFELGQGIALGARPGRPAFVDDDSRLIVPLSLVDGAQPPQRAAELAIVDVVQGALVDSAERIPSLQSPWIVRVQP